MTLIVMTEADAANLPSPEPGYAIDPIPLGPGYVGVPSHLKTHEGYAALHEALEGGEEPADLLAYLKPRIHEAIAARRWAAIRDGFTFGGSPVTLDDRAQARIDTAIAGLKRQPSGATVEWEVARGVFQTMDLATLEALGDAAFAHVQACFANSKPMMQAATDAADIAALNAIDLEAGWP